MWQQQREFPVVRDSVMPAPERLFRYGASGGHP